MSWKKLKGHIQSMSYRDFEKLVAKLLELLLEIEFAVAGAGDQPGGDAVDVEGKISIQAKRYTTTNLNLSSIEGEIHRTMRELPDFQFYVLAVSRDISSQQHKRINDIQNDTGIDIVSLDLTDKLSDLGALCVKFWEHIDRLFDLSNTNDRFLSWIKKMRDHPETIEKTEKIKLKLESGIQTQRHVQLDAKDHFLMCIGKKPNNNPLSSLPIDLSEVEDCPIFESRIINWWKNMRHNVCYLQGEKSAGKSSLAAKWVESICDQEDIVPFWLESAFWQSCQTLDDLLNTCFKSIYGGDVEGKITKLKHKIRKIWSIPALIILDNLNEQETTKILKQILHEYFEERRIGNTNWGYKIHLFITSQPFDDLQDFESSTRQGFIPIKVDPISVAISPQKVSEEKVLPAELPDELKPLVEIPKYSQILDRLKGQINSIELITKEMVIWVDLLEKIEKTDLHNQKQLSWSKSADPQEILATLAKQTKWTNIDPATQFSALLLKNCFSNYRQARHDFEKQRVALETDEISVEVNQDHVKLGWALYLSCRFDSLEFTTIRDFSDRFHQELEPFLTEDPRTEALFLSLQITAIFPKISQISLTQKRTALLLVLFNCPNPVLTQERLLFWAEQDTEAYVQFVQSVFKNRLLPNEEDVLIEPLAKIWRNKKGQFNHLESCLAKWLLPTYSVNSPENRVYTDVDGHRLPMMRYDPEIKLLNAAFSILSQRPEHQFLKTLAKCYKTLQRYESPVENIGRLMRWGYTETVLDDLHWLPELTEQNTDLLTGVYGLAAELKLVNLPILLQRPLSVEDKERRKLAEQWNKAFKPFIDRIHAHEKLLKDDSPDANVNGNYHGLDYLAVRTDLPDLRDDDLVKIYEVLQYISENAELGTGVGSTLEDYCIQNLIPWVSKNDPEGYAELACNLKLNTLNQRWAQFKLLSIQGLIFKPEDCKKITEAILGIKEQLAQEEDFYSDVTWLTHLLTESLLFCASEEILTEWFVFLASQEALRYSICYESLPYLFEYLLPTSIVELAQKKLEELRDASHEESNPSDQTSEKFSEEEYWCSLFSYGSTSEDRTVKYALEDLKMRKPDSTGAFPMLRLAYSDPKLFLDETLIDENIQKHLFSQNGRRWIICTYEGNDVPPYELLRSFLPSQTMGSFLCGTDRCADLSRWGRDLMKWTFSILEGNEADSNTVEETLSGINRKVLKTWAEQNQGDFLHLSEKYLTELSKSPWYRQVLSDFTNVIHCLLLRFQPEKAMKNYQQWSAENVRTIHYNEYRIETFLAQLWKVEQCNTSEHVQLRRNHLENCKNDEEIMFMAIAAIAGGGEKELWDLVEKEYVESHYAKERNLGVSILPWFGTCKAIELLKDLKSNDPSLWVRGHAKWAYEVAQQERSCKTVYREVLRTRDLFRISAAFERMKPALSPTARWWRRQIEEEELPENLEEKIQKCVLSSFNFGIDGGNLQKYNKILRFLVENLEIIVEVKNLVQVRLLGLHRGGNLSRIEVLTTFEPRTCPGHYLKGNQL